ncbi:MAG: hypothetical protein LBD16_04710, partial [Oscillospiraceae bacterium]|nr:hypothetical protein [Oscillospiraceae bacterium]
LSSPNTSLLFAAIDLFRVVNHYVPILFTIGVLRCLYLNDIAGTVARGHQHTARGYHYAARGYQYVARLNTTIHL